MRTKIALALALLLSLVGCGSSAEITVSDEYKSEMASINAEREASPTRTTSAPPRRATPSVTADATESSDTEDTATRSDEAAKIEESYIQTWGVDSLSELAGEAALTLPIWAISEWETITPDTIRVYVSYPLTDDEATRLGENILSLVGRDHPGLDVVVVRGLDGIDKNTYRRNVPSLN